MQPGIIIGLVIGLLMGAGVVYVVSNNRFQQKLNHEKKKTERAIQAHKESESQLQEFQQAPSQVQSLEQTHQVRIQSLEQDYQSQIQDLEQSYQSQIRELQQAQGQPSGLDSQAQIYELQQAHQKEIETIEQSYQAQIQNLQQAHRSEIQQSQQTKQTQLQEIEQAHQAKTRERETAYQSQILEVEETYITQIEDLQKQLRAQPPAEGDFPRQEPPETEPNPQTSGNQTATLLGVAGLAAAGIAAGVALTRPQEQEEKPTSELTEAEIPAAEAQESEIPPPVALTEEEAVVEANPFDTEELEIADNDFNFAAPVNFDQPVSAPIEELLDDETLTPDLEFLTMLQEEEIDSPSLDVLDESYDSFPDFFAEGFSASDLEFDEMLPTEEEIKLQSTELTAQETSSSFDDFFQSSEEKPDEEFLAMLQTDAKKDNIGNPKEHIDEWDELFGSENSLDDWQVLESPQKGETKEI